MALKTKALELLNKAGITVNGPNPWDIQVHNERLYGRALRQGALGLAESYMDGWWDVPSIDQFITKLVRHGIDQEAAPFLQTFIGDLMHRLFNYQSKARAFIVGQKHYDIGNDLYGRMLDPLMVYSCGYWKEAETLADAQIAKLDLICRKLKLEKGMRVLDIGCGWGGFAKHAAEKYGASVVGLTVSVEQAKLAQKVCEGLPVVIRVQDYRDVTEKFDRIVSVGMFEHVGYKNYRTYMKVARRCLKDDGLFLLHSIGGNESVTRTDGFVDKYIFPNGMIPSMVQITRAFEGVFEVMEDWHNFGPYYDKTLMAWNENFQRAWPELSAKYGERFKRMWEYYLLSSAAGFRARTLNLWQIVLSPNGLMDGYESVR